MSALKIKNIKNALKLYIYIFCQKQAIFPRAKLLYTVTSYFLKLEFTEFKTLLTFHFFLHSSKVSKLLV